MTTIKSETQPVPKRLIYFSVPSTLSENNNKIITRVYADYQTIPQLFNWFQIDCGFQLECATRTLYNLYNLHACRGNTNTANQLELESSMSGPHHYLGHIDPRDYISIHIPQITNNDQNANKKSAKIEYGLPIYTSYSADTNFDILDAQLDKQAATTATKRLKTKIPDEKILTIQDYKWIPGTEISSRLRKQYGNRKQLGVWKNTPDNKAETRVLINTNTGTQADSLFPNPGILELSVNEIQLQIINPDPATNGDIEYDFSPFGAQIVPNNRPWQFNQVGIQANRHAQHKLRLITYYYGSRYVPDYLMRTRQHPRGQGSGLFIERHEFIQAITPINPDCGGFVILGQELKTWTGRIVGLELIGVRVPFGYTLLVEPWAIHGDSNLTGLYSMAMTGNHLAMATADTVFLKNHNTSSNVRVVDKMCASANKQTLQPQQLKQPSGQQTLLMNSDQLSSDELNRFDLELKKEIRCGISWLESWYYNPVIWNPNLEKLLFRPTKN